MKKFQFSIVLIAACLFQSCSSPEKEFARASEENTTEAYMEFFDSYSYDSFVKDKFLRKTTNPDVLTYIAVNDLDSNIRMLALNRITDQKGYAEVILTSRHQEVVDTAWAMLTDQQVLQSLADTVPAAMIRLRAVTMIESDEFRLKVSREDISAAVRWEAVNGMKSEGVLRQVGLHSYYDQLRGLARQRITSKELVREINSNEERIRQRVVAIRHLNDQSALADLAVQGEYDAICMTAAQNLRDQDMLAAVATQTTDREVAKTVFAKLSDPAGLETVSQSNADNAIRLAADIKLGKKSLMEIFKGPKRDALTTEDLGDAIAAASLLPNQAEVGEAVTEACLSLIRLGDESRIPELVDLLAAYGDVSLTEDYLNCGQPDLYSAGAQWARDHGYDISSGYGSNRAQWGSGN